jgi:hypothetical protein
VILRHLGELLPEGALACANDPADRGGAVRLGDGRRVVERPAEGLDLAIEVRSERELLRDDERRDEHDPGATVRGQAAGEVERVLRLGPPEERHEDAAVADGGRASGDAAGLPAERAEIRAGHHRSWYGTLARMTPGSRSSSRFTYSAFWLCRIRRQPRVTTSGMTTSTTVSSSAVRSRR